MVTAKDFFASAQNKVTANTVETARFVKEGDNVVINMGFNIEVSAENDGWYVPLPVGKVFADFSEVEKYVVLPQDVKRFEIPTDVKVKKINAGGSYIANVGFLVETSAESDGYLLKGSDDSASRFVSSALYSAVFGDKQPIENQKLVEVGDRFQAIILEQDTTFNFIGGDYTAPAGEVLYENAEDEDGYTVVPISYFLRDHVVFQ